MREEQRRGVRARRTAVQEWMPRPSMVVRNWPIRSSRGSERAPVVLGCASIHHLDEVGERNALVPSGLPGAAPWTVSASG